MMIREGKIIKKEREREREKALSLATAYNIQVWRGSMASKGQMLYYKKMKLQNILVCSA